MRVSIFGLGYVGVVTAACLTMDGFEVVGIDINPHKVALLAQGRAPIVEAGLSELLQRGHAAGLLTATTSAQDAVQTTDVSLISVGTPSEKGGALNVTYVRRVCEEIGKAAACKGQAHVVVIRSTVMPGTTVECSRILRACAGDVPIHVAFNPEFLREGNALADYHAPPYTVIGTTDAQAEQAVRAIYAGVQAPVLIMQPAEAELIKLTSNAWHATKIVFANEIGRIAKTLGLDGRVVMQTITQDTKLNISPAYMRPGFAYGGSCLPKDVRALNALSRTEDVHVPLLSALGNSNQRQIEFALERIMNCGKRRIGFLGLSFKSGTDDLRESPAVELAERLIGKGYELRIFDVAVDEANLIGTNREFIQQRIPHLSRLMTASLDELAHHSEILVITHGANEFKEVVERVGPGTLVIDLVGKFDHADNAKDYDGIAW